jgi:uncharacterized protein
MANPAPWAVTVFATTSFMLGMFQTGLLNNAGVLIVLPAAFFFGGLVQIIVAIMEFSRGNLFAGAVFGTYGPFWVIFGAFETLYAASVPAAQLSSATVLAWYHAAGDIIEATFGRKVLPFGPPPLK